MHEVREMDRVTHRGRGALVLRTDGERALISQHGVAPYWARCSELEAVQSLPERIEEAICERESLTRGRSRALEDSE